ncbi:MAG: HD domain-containing phosphohydrolase, partial [Phycisphaerales bacterium]|nr:HD domain-containing phosphohydrolase [Phycisphaerales bacterium]
ALAAALNAETPVDRSDDRPTESRNDSEAGQQMIGPGEMREAVSRLVSSDTGALLVDDQWLVSFVAGPPAAPGFSLISHGDRLRWIPRSGAGASGDDSSEISNFKSEITLQLPDGPQFAVAKPLANRAGYVILYLSDATLDERVSEVLQGLTGVSLVTFVWIAALLGACGFILAGRFQDEAERERSRSLSEAALQRKDLIRTRDAVIVGLAKLAESRDSGIGDHLDRISRYAMALATAMMRHPEFMVEVTPSFVRLIGFSAALHDIGKVGVEDRILLKPGKLTASERSRMEDHSRIGGDCLREIERRLGRSNFLQMAREIAFSHHERWDGSGYPAGLRGERIPLAARIVAIGDVYDALSSRRVYKEPLPHDKCVAIIREGAGTQFDPRIVEIWLTVASKFRDIAERYSNSRTQTFDEQVEDEPAPATETCGSLMSVVTAALEAPVERG